MFVFTIAVGVCVRLEFCCVGGLYYVWWVLPRFIVLSGCRFCGIARCLVFDFGWVLSSGFDLLRLACFDDCMFDYGFGCIAVGL